MFIYSKLKILTKGNYIASYRRLGGFSECGVFNEFFAPTFKVVHNIFDNFNIISIETNLRCVRTIITHESAVKTTTSEDYYSNSKGSLRDRIGFCKNELFFCDDPMVRYMIAKHEEFFPSIMRAAFFATPEIFCYNIWTCYSDIFYLTE